MLRFKAGEFVRNAAARLLLAMSATEFPLVMKGICEENLEDLRTLNRALFPINYTERVYADILACGDVSQLAYDAEGHLVGGIGCRLENTPQVRGRGLISKMSKDGNLFAVCIVLGSH